MTQPDNLTPNTQPATQGTQSQYREKPPVETDQFQPTAPPVTYEAPRVPAPAQPSPPVVDEGVTTSAWRWACATIILFPLFIFWSIPAAARSSQKAILGDARGAAEERDTAKNWGVGAIVIFVIISILYIIGAYATYNM